MIITPQNEKSQVVSCAVFCRNGRENFYSLEDRWGLPGLEVLEEDVALLGFLTPVTNDNARAVDDLAWVTLTVENTETSPLSELLAIGDLNQWDLVFRAQCLDEFLVRIFVTGLVEDTHVSLATVEGLGSLAKTTGETVVDEGMAENTLQSVFDSHLAFASGIGGNFNLLGSFDLRDIFSCVRHDERWEGVFG